MPLRKFSFTFLLYGVLFSAVDCLSSESTHDQSVDARNSKKIQDKDPKAISIGKLQPDMIGKRITVRFTVAKLYGIAQLVKEGQAPSFGIRPEIEHDVKKLDVWIVGELANEMRRKKTAFLQANELLPKTIILGTGIIRLHNDTTNGELYFMEIAESKHFRVLPPDPGKKLKRPRNKK